MNQYPVTAGIVAGCSATADAVCACLRSHGARIVIERHARPLWTELCERLTETHADLLIVDISTVDSMAETLSLIRSLPAPPVIAALHTSASPDLILEAVRAGAADFLYPPFEQTIPTALARLCETRQNGGGTGRKMGRVIGLTGAKGGCGTTTIACHLAVELPRHTGERALLADLDFDAGLIAFVMKTKSDYSLWDAARNLHRLDLSFWSKIVSNGQPGLHVITAPREPGASLGIDAQSLREIVAFARREYEWVLLDLGRGIGQPHLQALDFVDEIFVVTTMEITSLHLARTVVQKITDSGVPKESIRILVNRTGLPDDLDLTVRELGKALDHPVYSTVPNDYSSLQDCYTQGRLLGEDARIRRQIAALARRMAGLPEEKPKRRFPFFR